MQLYLITCNNPLTYKHILLFHNVSQNIFFLEILIYTQMIKNKTFK